MCTITMEPDPAVAGSTIHVNIAIDVDVPPEGLTLDVTFSEGGLTPQVVEVTFGDDGNGEAIFTVPAAWAVVVISVPGCDDETFNVVTVLTDT